VDIHCECGALTHLDAEFAYYVQCSACGRCYGMSPNVVLVPVTEEEIKALGHRIQKTNVESGA